MALTEQVCSLQVFAAFSYQAFVPVFEMKYSSAFWILLAVRKVMFSVAEDASLQSGISHVRGEILHSASGTVVTLAEKFT